MPSTRQINDYYSITVEYDRKQGSTYVATAQIYREDTGQRVGRSYSGEGRTLTAAENRALAAARAECPSTAPLDWQGK